MGRIVETVEDGRTILAAVFAQASDLVALTGAGISTESGVPDFRSPGSPWRRYPPIDFASFLASPDTRVEAWRRKFAMDDIYAGAGPSRTHRALTQLHRAGPLSLVVTQNIDGLHQAAGLPEDSLVELHGNGTFARCLSCGERHALVTVRAALERDGTAPTCRCGGMVKSATIAFGQTLPAAALDRAVRATRACDVFLVLGSSLVVRPAATLPRLAAEAGATLVIVNREPTPLDEQADAVVRADVGSVLAPWALNGKIPSAAA